MNQQWFSVLKSTTNARLRLYCFPYAGAGHTVFQHWQQYLSPEIELALVKLPGRGARYNEPAATELESLIAAFAESLSIDPAIPFAFFGHSMGALLAVETCHWLNRHNRPLPIALLASGRSAPIYHNDRPVLSQLPPDQFADVIKDLNGMPQEIADDPELLDFFLPIIRADFELCERYQYQAQATLDLPIIAISGDKDPYVPLAELKAWQNETSRLYEEWIYPGDHFYLFQHEATLLPRISQYLIEYAFVAPTPSGPALTRQVLG